MRKSVYLICIAMIAHAATAASAAEISLEISVPEPTFALTDSGVVETGVAGLRNLVVPGKPVIPVRLVRALLPPGERPVSAVVRPLDPRMTALVAKPAWGPRFFPYSEPADRPDPEPDAAVYGSNDLYPAVQAKTLGVQYKMGAAILPIAVYPVRFNPAGKTAVTATRFAIDIRTEKIESANDSLASFRGLPEDIADITRLVENPGDIGAYLDKSGPMKAELDYLVIGPKSYFNLMKSWADSKADFFAMTTETATIERIEETFDGETTAEKVRNCLRDAYERGARWALLIGDADAQKGQEVLPLQGLYVTGTDPDDLQTYTETEMASDLYYGCLDGTYNDDGDNYFGEDVDGPDGGDVDMFADIYVGRWALEKRSQFENIIAKTSSFETDVTPPAKVMLVAEILDSWTDGADSIELVYDKMNEVEADRYYDSLGNSGYWEIVSAINSNEYQLLTHLGHASVQYNMGFTPWDLSDLENNVYYAGFTQGCYSGSVDGVDSYGRYSGDSMGEYFTLSETGAFAYIANTRYGFYLQGRDDGPSNVYNWEWAEAIFSDGMPGMGAALAKAREDSIGLLDPNTMMRWASYTLFLFGDPHTPLKFDCDNDEDGFEANWCGADDCDDLAAAINPNAEEVCDGEDNNCDGQVDEGCGDDDTADDDSIDDDSADDDAADDDDAVNDDDAADDDAAGDDDAIDDDDDASDDDQSDDDLSDDDADDDSGSPQGSAPDDDDDDGGSGGCG